ncbi:tetraacyldisaccharide 4'-kinase [Prosthecomicrobium pneumaticum]|uniref:Tetraacyldisaccharide 4'-kinase n=1 Tax=Prosthecomicrobium pneumaticum TaxID=81895 RepID=A0A7W9CUG1_9HYPH|nr:tetraacyldisaccharide 4'-kinase [Prosthecomicrobium pneumaticum]MBB5752107.1 tetraacyldisaccharide 4'-kinase [Prosthecomicrobium pneumaticum]
MIKAPGFWWRRRPTAAALGLAPAGLVYGAVSASRMRRPPELVAPVPVVCIGNFTVGGAGKTPTALALARIARTLGRTPGFLTRGYGGRAGAAAVVDPAIHDPAIVGDEAILLAAEAKTVVSADRPAGARLLVEEGVDLVIMDDGFQNPALAKDLSLLVVDGGAGIGNGFVFPAGPLRAPLAAQMVRADAVLVVGEGAAGDKLVRRAARAGKPVLRARLEPVPDQTFDAAGYLAYAGIGRPEKFFDSLVAAGVPLKEARGFPDHHVFTVEDAHRLRARAAEADLALISTEKDMARLARATRERGELRERTTVFRVRLAFADEGRVRALFTDMLRRIAVARPRPVQ